LTPRKISSLRAARAAKSIRTDHLQAGRERNARVDVQLGSYGGYGFLRVYRYSVPFDA
jgi:hypothetical protein